MPKKILTSILPELQQTTILTRIYDFFKIIVTPPKPGNKNNKNKETNENIEINEIKEKDLEQPLIRKVDSFELIKFSDCFVKSIPFHCFFICILERKIY
jgi:hypothetical protein